MKPRRGARSRAAWRLRAWLGAGIAAASMAIVVACAPDARAADARPPATSTPPAATSAPGDPGCPPEAVPITAAEVPAALRDAVDSGFLWRVTRAGRTSWLYGTIHVAERGWVLPGPHVVSAMRSSDEVALELDPTDPDIAARTMALFARKPGTSDLPAELQARLQERARASCVQPQIASSVRPELLAVQLEVMVGRRLGLYPAYGIDLFLASMAHGAGKPLRSLETPEAQVALLVSDDPKETRRRVEDALDGIDNGDAVRVLQRMAGDWRRGDLADLERYRTWCDCEKTAEEREFLRKVVDERNPKMAEQVARWHGDGRSMFVAVGALHLIGPRGVPALLQDKGFTVERVEFGH